jgi:hypothetical protein
MAPDDAPRDDAAPPSAVPPSAAPAKAKRGRPKLDRAAAVKPLAELGLERYTMATIERSQLTGAPYNPRVMTAAERHKLRVGVQRHGLVAPITWNMRTGHIVGGHQRIAALDALARTSQYSLQVAAIDVDEAREKELAILLNNPEAQGDWDLDKLKAVLQTEGLQLDGTGFDRSDLFRVFGEDWAQWFQPATELPALAARVQEFREKFEIMKAHTRARESEEFYLVVVFRDGADRNAFLAEHGLDDNRYQSGAVVRRLIAGEPEDRTVGADVRPRLLNRRGGDVARTELSRAPRARGGIARRASRPSSRAGRARRQRHA